MDDLLSKKQMQFITESTARWNLAHGSVRSGKTVCTLFRFMQAAYECPDSKIWMIGHTSESIYSNAVRLLLEDGGPNDPLAIFRPYLVWYAGKRQLKFRDKTISTLGAKDEGSIGGIQGKTFSLFYGDEMTLFPESITYMIDTRLSTPHSMGFASMNPSHPTHALKQWIDKAESGDKNYYQLHFSLDDNPYVDDGYKQRIRDSLSGLFYKRNYLGLWCLAEGAIFDFFDHKIHVVHKPPRAAEYWIAGIDYGTSNNFACVLVGINTGINTQMGVCRWVEKEYVWDSHAKARQKTNSEYADDVEEFLEAYGVKAVYVDPSAAAFKLELRRRGIHVVDADNDVENGIQFMTSQMAKGNLFVCDDCPILIKEIESYVWDPKKAEKGEDAPLKKNDHCCVTGDTLITIKRCPVTLGRLEVSIKELSEFVKNNGTLYNLNTFTNKVESDTYKNPTLTRENAEIFELELEDGKVLKATGDHQVMTKRGYIALQELTLSDIVLTCSIKTISTKNSTKTKKQDTGFLQRLPK